jgi:tRNA pseudouridine55 synthase
MTLLNENPNPNAQSENGAGALLLVDKPSGWTSHDAVMVARKKLGISRIGHAGTLDPAATGLLLLLIGPAVRSQTEFQKAPKIYSGVMSFGAETDTWDADGKVVAERPVPEITDAMLNSAIASFTGLITQIVPPYSAVKFKGEPLHRIARRGGVLPPAMMRQVTIYGWDEVIWKSPELSFRVKCSSGTYVRALAHMLGAQFGCGAHLKTLRRLKVGHYDVAQAVSAEWVRDSERAAVESRMIAPAPAV